MQSNFTGSVSVPQSISNFMNYIILLHNPKNADFHDVAVDCDETTVPTYTNLTPLKNTLHQLTAEHNSTFIAYTFWGKNSSQTKRRPPITVFDPSISTSMV
jgi:hypothetical protein